MPTLVDDSGHRPEHGDGVDRGRWGCHVEGLTLSVFKNGRHFSAWLGWVPRQHSTGGQTRLLGISKSVSKKVSPATFRENCLLMNALMFFKKRFRKMGQFRAIRNFFDTLLPALDRSFCN
jgi:Transposase IS116/IS110/IS902 family